ncbi:MAG: NAD(P)H-binding protein [Chloroflexi bacterium]|nr:NAD(P)H-binding protein [Chloroflexota bacterium]
MDMSELNVVTGAFGYTGKYVARRLLSMGIRVKTITGHPDRPSPFGGEVAVAPFNFDDPPALVKELSGASTLYNTYWIRFSRGEVTFERAIENTRTLINCARDAGVNRVVHISITNPTKESALSYFRGKGIVEEIIKDSGLSYAILRPTVIFGIEDILVNNIAWLLRRFPMFFVLGSGNYRLQPVFVEDLAELAVTAGNQEDNVTMDAAGPDIYTFDEFLGLLSAKLGRKPRLVHVPPKLALFLSQLMGRVVGDVVLTRDEVAGLMADLLISQEPPKGRTSLSDWLDANAELIGMRYTSELARHYRR